MGFQDGDLFARLRIPQRAVWSADAVTTRFPSGLNDAARTQSSMGFQDGDLFARLGIPQTRRLVELTPSPRVSHPG